MRYPQVQFVSAPSPDASVRFDFNEDAWADENVWPDHDGFSVGVPTLEGDPDGVGVEYGLRELSFDLLVEGSKHSALARQSALAREILRRENWLRFQLSATSQPVWFKTYRSQPGDLSFEHVYVDRPTSMWGISVSLAADPFAYGEEVTLPAARIYNDPAAGSNPMSMVLPEIKGDAPAPLRVRVGWSANRVLPDVLLAHTSYESSSYAAPLAWQSSAFTAGTDTGAPVADAASSGGQYVPVSFATNAARVQRLSGPAPTSLTPGRYAVFARVAVPASGSVFTLAFGQEVLDGSATAVKYGPTTTLSGRPYASPYATWVNLGEHTFPFGLPFDSAGRPPAHNPAPNLSLAVGRTSGASELRVDAFLLVPVRLPGDSTGSLLSADFPSNPGTTTINTIWDAEQEFVYAESTVDVRPIPRLRGGFPQAVPGRTNVMHFLWQTRRDFTVVGNASPDVITDTVEVTPSYQPRWLYLADA